MKQKLLAGIKPALLEEWYRDNYFTNEIDISGSGVEDYTYGDLCKMAGVDFAQLNDIKIGDAPTLGSKTIRKQLSLIFGDGDAEKVIVTSGGNEGLQLIVRSLLGRGDKIITLGPCYHCHDQIAESIGVSVLKWNIPIDDSDDLNLESLKSLLNTGVKAIFLNFPHNPTGRTISQAQLDEIVTLAKEQDTIIVWDAVFQGLTHHGNELQDPVLSYDRSVSIGTFSKVYGAPGLRFGWIISSFDFSESCARQKDHGNLYVPLIVEFIASKMLSELSKFSTPRRKQAGINRTLVDDWLNENTFGMSWVKPKGGACGLIKIPDGITDYEFCERLLENHGVLLVPGSCFGCPGYVRLGFGGNTQHLAKGLSLLAIFLTQQLY